MPLMLNKPQGKIMHSLVMNVMVRSKFGLVTLKNVV